MTAIRAESLVFSYPGQNGRALDRLSLSVETGEFCGLLGPNGAGKTTLLSVLCGLLRPGAGRVRLLGAAPSDRGVKTQMGFCPQDLALYPTLSARENLELFGVLAGLDRPRLADRISSVLETVGLTSNADRRVDQFSGGMRRRLNLAVAVLHEPKLLLLDEPTVGVDAQSRSLIFESLRALNRSGTTILFATHYMEEAERLCARLFIMDQGKVLASGETRALVSEGGTQRVFVEIEESSRDAMILALRLRGHAAVAVSGGRLELRADRLADLLGDVAAAAGDAGAVLRGIEGHRPTLEDRFLELTGRHLRD